MSKQQNKNLIKNLLLKGQQIAKDLLKDEHTIDCEFCKNKDKKNCPRKRLKDWEHKISILFQTNAINKKQKFHNTFKRNRGR